MTSARPAAPPAVSAEIADRPAPSIWWRLPSRIVTLCIAELQRLRHDRSELYTRSIQPALWLVIYGETMQRLHTIPTGGVPYLDYLAPGILARMQAAEAMTAGNARLQLSIAASYGGRQDIANAARALAEDVAAGRLRPDQIDEDAISARVALSDLPVPDLFIRTGGELRVSNFLLWQLAYTELWFTDTLWPDVDAATLRRALDDYAGRERRYGLTSAQVAGHATGGTT